MSPGRLSSPVPVCRRVVCVQGVGTGVSLCCISDRSGLSLVSLFYFLIPIQFLPYFPCTALTDTSHVRLFPSNRIIKLGGGLIFGLSPLPRDVCESMLVGQSLMSKHSLVAHEGSSGLFAFISIGLTVHLAIFSYL